MVLDPETGRTEGYAVAEAMLDGYDWYWLWLDSGGWIVADGSSQQKSSFVLHRATGQSWSWPSNALQLVAASREHLLFAEITRSAPPFTGRLTITNRAMKEVGRFSIASGWDPRAVFSPDGRTIALSEGRGGEGGSVYLIAVESARPTVLLQAGAHDGPTSAWIDLRYEGPGFLVRAEYTKESDETHREEHYFRWEDGSLSDPTPVSCEGQPSPDGRYVARPVGGYVYETHSGVHAREDPWPSLVITEAATCAPLFRVRSAQTFSPTWQAAWLPSSDGFVIHMRDGGMMVRVRPTPDLVRLPGSGEPAPTGDGRYFGYGARVYDALEDRWLGPVLFRDGPAGWGDSHRERWFQILPYVWGPDGWLEWLLLPPKIEFPPFRNEIAFRVAGTGSCLRLRAAPGEESETQDCLPDGARLVLAEPNEPPHDLWRPQPHPAVAWTEPRFVPRSTWVHVRTEAGAEGWVSHDYLEHD